jgi:LPS-assembly lipoprotein
MKKVALTKSNIHSSKRREYLGGGLALLAVGVLSACGWRVRGKIDLPYKSLLVSGTMTPELRNDLEMYLRMNGVNLVTRAQDAEVILEIITEQNAKQVLSYNGAGQITAYRIICRIAFRVFNPEGVEILPEADIYMARDIEFNQANIQSFDVLVTEFVKNMRIDIVGQLMRRLASIKKLPGQESSNTTKSSKEDKR